MNTGPSNYQDIFELRGASHDEAFRRFPRTASQEVETLLRLADPKAGEILVDVPSAGGFLSDFVRTPGVRVLSVDPSPVMHELCIRHGRESYLAPVDAMPFADGSIDVVVCLAGLHHEPHLDRAFTEIRRVLKPQVGRLAIAEVAAGTRPGRFLNGFVDRHNSMGHKGDFLDDAFLLRLAGAGFRVVRNEDAHYHWPFESTDALGECLRLMFGIDRATPAEIAAAVASELGIDELPDGWIGMRWMLRHVLAYPV